MTPRIIAIGSGKGGTGKTLIAVSCAYALAQAGERVLLCDADLGLSNTVVHLGLDCAGSMQKVLRGTCDVADAVTPVLGGSTKQGGFDVLSTPAGSGLLSDASREDARRLMTALRGAENYDRVLIDLGAGVHETTMLFATQADETLLVMTPDPSALTDAYAFAKLMLRATPRSPLVVVNMTSGEADARRTFDALAMTARTFLKSTLTYLGGIPRDAKVADAVRRQSHLLKLHPAAPASGAITTLAGQLHAKLLPDVTPPLRASLR